MVGNGIAILAYRLGGEQVGLEAGVAWNTLTVTVVNILCFGILLWRFRVEDISMVEVIGFRRQPLLRDVLLGIFLSIVLGAMMLLGVTISVLAQHPGERFGAFETAFVGDADFTMHLPLWLAVVSAVVFPIVNAPIEELHYRGYAQPGLIRATCRPGLGIVVTAAGFGLQHAAFALTSTAAVAYVVGFFLWGLGAGMIAHRQQRLVPLIIAHFLSNLPFGILPLLFVLTSS